MGNSSVDHLALSLGLLLAAAMATALEAAYRGQHMRRLWAAGAALAVLLIAAGTLDLLRASPRETHIATVIVGATLPVLGGVGVARGARRARWWLRWLLVFLTTLVLLLAGLLLGATLAARLL
ncbi:MAG: hypothetical protein WD801_07115 [Gemmatimonadaceae bacterium]